MGRTLAKSLAKVYAAPGVVNIRAARYRFRPGVSLALDAGPPSPLIAPSSLGKEMRRSPLARDSRTMP